MAHIQTSVKNGRIEDLPVLVLCGGEGKRLRPVVSDRPKVMAKVGDRPFIDVILNWLIASGFRRIILSVGYRKEDIIGYLHPARRGVEFSEEQEPLGTGGAVKKALPLVRTDHVVVLNGDSFCPVDFRGFLLFHLGTRGALSMVLTKHHGDREEYGTVHIDKSSKILRFVEKSSQQEPAFVNAGVYLMRTDIISRMPDVSAFSLEYDFFPRLVRNGECFGFLTDGRLVDIGTPDRYREANRLFAEDGFALTPIPND